MKPIYLLLSFLLLAGQLSAQITPGPGNILYVKKGSTGNGSSWTNALGEVADALKYAKQNENQWTASNLLQIWVAGGTYVPKYSPNDGENLTTTPTDPRDVSFLLVNFVQLYGGFAGSESALAARDLILTANTSTLRAANGCYNVILSVDSLLNENKIILDGFTVSGGSANRGLINRVVNTQTITRTEGGGMLLYNSACTVNNATFTGNNAYSGGGIACISGSFKLTNVSITANHAVNRGGGIFLYESVIPPSLTNSVISGNTAIYGGGVFDWTSSCIMENVAITGNTATNTAGGVFNYSGNFPSYSNVTISGNVAPLAGAMHNQDNANPYFINCIILGNSSGNVYSNNGNVNIRYSLIRELNSTANGNLDATGITAYKIFINYVPAQLLRLTEITGSKTMRL